MSEEEFMENDETFSLTREGWEKFHAGELEDLDEEKLLILTYIDGRERQELPPPTMAEIEAIHDWGQRVRSEALTLEMTLNRHVYVELVDGEILFRLAPEGMEHLRELGLAESDLDFDNFEQGNN